MVNTSINIKKAITFHVNLLNSKRTMTYYGDEIPWQILLMEETGVPGENHRPAANHRQTLSHNVVSSTLRHERGSNSQW